MIHRLINLFIREYIEFLYLIPVNILFPRHAEDIDETRFAHLAPDDLERQRQIAEKSGKITRCTRVSTFFFDNKALDGDDFIAHECLSKIGESILWKAELLLFVLKFVQPAVDTVLGKKFLVCSALADFAFVENNDLV